VKKSKNLIIIILILNQIKNIMDLIYESLITHTMKTNEDIINIKKEREDLLGFQYSLKSTEITDDKRIIFPKLMIMKIIPNSIAEKHNLRLGSQIISINDIDVTLENYKELIKNKNLKIKVNNSYCMIYQMLLRENKFNFLY
jgi:hypothetical protein